MVVTTAIGIVGGAILLAWLIGQVVAWTRADRESRDEIGRFIGKRLVRQWPLLVVLLAPLAASAVTQERAQWLLIAIAGIIAWWGAEAEGALRQPPRLLRDPLRCGVAAARRLWRSRWLIAVFAGLWVLPWAAEGLVTVTGLRPHPAGAATVEIRPELQRLQPDLRAIAEWVEGTAQQHFPSAIGDIGGGWVFAVLALAVGFGYLRFSRNTPEDRRRQMQWPFRLTALYALILLAQYVLWPRWSLQGFGGAGAAGVIAWSMGVLSFVWGAPAEAAVWGILLQVVRGERWNVREGLIAASETWPLFVPLLAVLHLPVELSAPPWLEWGTNIAAYQFWSGLTSEFQWFALLALMLVPWIIADRRVGLRVALRQSWEHARERPSGIMAFVLRYAAVMALWSVLARMLVAPDPFAAFAAKNLASSLLHGPVAILGTLAVGVLYLRLHRPGADEQVD